MVYHTIHLPLIDMREKPVLNGPIISQATFSEHIWIKKKGREWSLIVTMDGYSGWVPNSSFLEKHTPYVSRGKITNTQAHIYLEPNAAGPPILTLPYGAKLRILKRVNERWLKIILPNDLVAFIQRGDLSKEPKGLIKFSKKFLGIPYVWGGRSSFGYDCSGYVQMLYSWLGFTLPRDAHLQFRDPRGRAIELDSLETGDLIFWGKSQRLIQHVGLYIDNGQFIHTSSREEKPYLRISNLDDVEWSGQKKCHYPFRAARRFF